MKKMKLEVMILGVAIAVVAYAQEAPADENNPPNAVIKLDVSTAKPDIFCPWANRTGASSGTGVVIAPGRILKGRTKENLWDISSPPGNHCPFSGGCPGRESRWIRRRLFIKKTIKYTTHGGNLL